jgi:Cell division protein 48 (CDC48), N-terminal domain
MNKIADAIPLIVAENEIQDNARKIVRLDPHAMSQMNVSDGDPIEVISQLTTELFTVLALIPTDTSTGVIRLDRDGRDILGTGIGDTIFVKRAENRDDTALERSKINSPLSIGAEERSVESRTAVLISGSCIDFENQRHKIMDYLNTLAMEVHMKSDCKCYSEGKKILGWDFFQISFPLQLVEKIKQIHPEIDKHEGNTLEDRFVIWLSERMKKKQLEYHLKISEIPYEPVSGFRLDPKNYQNANDRDDLK